MLGQGNVPWSHFRFACVFSVSVTHTWYHLFIYKILQVWHDLILFTRSSSPDHRFSWARHFYETCNSSMKASKESSPSPEFKYCYLPKIHASSSHFMRRYDQPIASDCHKPTWDKVLNRRYTRPWLLLSCGRLQKSCDSSSFGGLQSTCCLSHQFNNKRLCPPSTLERISSTRLAWGYWSYHPAATRFAPGLVLVHGV